MISLNPNLQVLYVVHEPHRYIIKGRELRWLTPACAYDDLDKALKAATSNEWRVYLPHEQRIVLPLLYFPSTERWTKDHKIVLERSIVEIREDGFYSDDSTPLAVFDNEKDANMYAYENQIGSYLLRSIDYKASFLERIRRFIRKVK
jgi:hypothetical protein